MIKSLSCAKNLFRVVTCISCCILSNFSFAICNMEELSGRPPIPESTPNSQLLDNGDGTITDIATGLMWRQCSQGQAADGICSGIGDNYIWQLALDVPNSINTNGGFAGYSDWRLPNIKELRSIVEVSCTGPSINEERFPNTSLSTFWTSSPYASDPTWSWGVFFIYGDSSGRRRSLPILVFIEEARYFSLFCTWLLLNDL